MAVFVIFILFALFTLYSSVQGDKGWKRIAKTLDLEYKSRWIGGKKLEGHRRGFKVRIQRVPDSENNTKLVAKILGVDPGFTLGRDSALLRMVKPDIETGDRVFDERMRIEGDPDWALALLDDEARRLAGIVISAWNGELKRHVLKATFQDITITTSTLDTLIDLAQMLDQPPRGKLPKLLMERASHDSSSAVRLQALRRLASSHAFRKEALAAAEASLDASSLPLPLEACRLLVRSGAGKSGLAAEKLAKLATGDWIESSIRRMALEHLGESRHRQIAIAAMSQALGHWKTPTEVRSAALEGLIAIGAKAELIEIEIGDDEAEIVARGLGRFDASVEPRLLQFLEDSPDRVRMAAVKSLGRVGTRDAIPALRRVAGQDRLFRSAVARDAEHAIATIKSRSGGSQQGEISIVRVTPLEGAISPSDDSEAGGEVSLTS